MEITLIDVNDSIPEFSAQSYVADCSESAVIGYTVTTTTASDADEIGNLTYSLSDSGGAFSISSQGKGEQIQITK